MLSLERVKNTAHLARLALTDQQLFDLRDDLNAIVQWIDAIDKVDLSKETMPVVQDPDLMEESPHTCAQNPEDLLRSVPDRRGFYVGVPLVME